MIVAAKRNLPVSKPLHLFGAGHPLLFPFLVALGCDLFDSAAYALYARAGRYLTSDGTLLLPDIVEFSCGCPTCIDKSPDELMRTDPAEREVLLAQHNLWACFSELRRIREAIRKGRLWELLEIRARAHPSLADCFQRIRFHSGLLERATPAVKQRGIFSVGYSSWDRPEAIRYRSRLQSSIDEKEKLLLLLPGRWRRPFHEDPRYQIVSKSFDDDPTISICYYSLTWGPVPIELDETFPIAQTEGRDTEDPFQYQAKAESVIEYVEKLQPKKLILVVDGAYGRSISGVTLKRLGKRKVTLLKGDTMNPNAIIESVRKIVSRRS
jgi:7-cyano-7-deazaguanine tRNA-ribosyltransferase